MGNREALPVAVVLAVDAYDVGVVLDFNDERRQRVRKLPRHERYLQRPGDVLQVDRRAYYAAAVEQFSCRAVRSQVVQVRYGALLGTAVFEAVEEGGDG